MDFNTENKENLIRLLTQEDPGILFEQAAAVKRAHVGNKVYLRGLIEYSNRCTKNCYYCGVRCGNGKVERYTLSDDEVLEAAKLAYTKNFGSLVIQSGERSDKAFVDKIAHLLREIRKLSDDKLRVTLSMGEQTEETYRLWYESGARRYLLRIEASNPELYRKIHPNDERHSYDRRLEALDLLRKTGYQTGTGVMIGLPFQSVDDLAGDLLFIKKQNIDMVGMGPYIEHHATPLYRDRAMLMAGSERLVLSLKMVALLRIMMPDINIAATTAMQTLHPEGREQALKAGANVVMPNLTPLKYREGYLLYENKPGIHEETETSLKKLRMSIHKAGCTMAQGEWGDSRHYLKRARD